MGRLLLLPLLVAWCLVIPLGYWGWQIMNHAPPHGTAPPGTYPANLDEQRRLAACYRLGCAEARASPILSCAWRLVIAEETHGSDDSAEAARDCEALAEKDRQTAEKVKRTVLRALHIEPGKTHP